jgi:chromosome segregation ATPase
LVLVNAVGCLVLGLLLVLQWGKERDLDWRIHELKVRLVAVQDQYAAECERTKMLDQERSLLKESIQSMQRAAEETGKLLAARDARVAELEPQLAKLNEQLKTWQAAILQRDERIHALDADLSAARRRLDEAIAKLKAEKAP